MSKVSYFPATQSEKDQAWRMRVVESTKGVLGQSIEKTGFLKFDTEAEADSATEMLDSEAVTLSLGDKISRPGDQPLYDVKVELVEAAVSAGAIAH